MGRAEKRAGWERSGLPGRLGNAAVPGEGGRAARCGRRVLTAPAAGGEAGPAQCKGAPPAPFRQLLAPTPCACHARAAQRRRVPGRHGRGPSSPAGAAAFAAAPRCRGGSPGAGGGEKRARWGGVWVPAGPFLTFTGVTRAVTVLTAPQKLASSKSLRTERISTICPPVECLGRRARKPSGGFAVTSTTDFPGRGTYPQCS